MGKELPACLTYEGSGNCYRLKPGTVEPRPEVRTTGSTSAKSPGVIFPKLAGVQNCGCHLLLNNLNYMNCRKLPVETKHNRMSPKRGCGERV